jgi:hypothetical protein
MESIWSVLLGLLFAWAILMYVPVRTKVSYYTLNPWPLEMDDSNLAIIGVGLAAPKPKPSVMDATPAVAPKYVMMKPKPVQQSQMPVPAPVQQSQMPVPAPVQQSQMPVPAPVQPVSMTASPISIMRAPGPSA